MADHNELGKLGENLAQKFLIDNGFEIVATNWRCRKYEVDIIANKDNMLVFVEVKTRTPCGVSTPEDSMNRAKQKQLVEAADIYIKEHNINLEARIDLISIFIKDKKYWVKHTENAVIPRW